MSHPDQVVLKNFMLPNGSKILSAKHTPFPFRDLSHPRSTNVCCICFDIMTLSEPHSSTQQSQQDPLDVGMLKMFLLIL